jgi:hypothetical protein
MTTKSPSTFGIVQAYDHLFPRDNKDRLNDSNYDMFVSITYFEIFVGFYG